MFLLKRVRYLRYSIAVKTEQTLIPYYNSIFSPHAIKLSVVTPQCLCQLNVWKRHKLFNTSYMRQLWIDRRYIPMKQLCPWWKTLQWAIPGQHCGIYTETDNVKKRLLIDVSILKHGEVIETRIITRKRLLPWTVEPRHIVFGGCYETSSSSDTSKATRSHDKFNGIPRPRDKQFHVNSAVLSSYSFMFLQEVWMMGEWMNSDHSLIQFKKNQRLHRYPQC